jgi:hypothetical protein
MDEIKLPTFGPRPPLSVLTIQQHKDYIFCNGFLIFISKRDRTDAAGEDGLEGASSDHGTAHTTKINGVLEKVKLRKARYATSN